MTSATIEIADWDLAGRTARRLTRSGPQVSRFEAARAVAQLRAFAEQSEGHVREFTELTASPGTAPVLVVDRPGWIQANLDAFNQLTRPLADKAAARMAEKSPNATSLGPATKVTGLEIGSMLAFMSSRVLGQFDPFWPPRDAPRADATSGSEATVTDAMVDPAVVDSAADAGGAAARMSGRLLLVAPNVVEIERELEVDPRDFRFWVCLHEETHRVQFTAVPWLPNYVRSLIDEFFGATDLDASAMAERLRSVSGELSRSLRGKGGDVSLATLMLTPQQKIVVDKITAVMSLLEGHADVVMDGVGPAVIPTVEHIREKFENRRSGTNPIETLVRKLLGLDLKLKQYRDGAVFVRGAVDQVGMHGFNAVWAHPENLPLVTELTDPAAWVSRVHG